MKTLFVVACLLGVIFSAPLDKSVGQVREKKDLSVNVEFSGNASVSNDQGSFSYRAASIFEVPLVGVFHSSVQVEGEAEIDGNGNGSGNFEANGIFGLAFLGQTTYPPFSMMGFFETAGNLAGNTNAGNAGSFDFAGSSSFLGMVFPQIQEIDASGNVVKTVPLKSLSYTGDLQTALEQDGKMLKYYVMSGTPFLQPSLSGLEVKIGYIVSNVIGRLSTGAIITPKSVETQIEITDYPYADATNHLELTMIIVDCHASGSGSGTVTGNTYQSGTGEDSVYFTFAGDAIIDGSSSSVSVDIIASAESEIVDSGASFLVSSLSALESSHDTEVYTATVAFQAGASSISYDPSSGFENPSSSSFAIPSFITFLAVMFALFRNL